MEHNSVSSLSSNPLINNEKIDVEEKTSALKKIESKLEELAINEDLKLTIGLVLKELTGLEKENESINLKMRALEKESQAINSRVTKYKSTILLIQDKLNISLEINSKKDYKSLSRAKKEEPTAPQGQNSKQELHREQQGPKKTPLSPEPNKSSHDNQKDLKKPSITLGKEKSLKGEHLKPKDFKKALTSSLASKGEEIVSGKDSLVSDTKKDNLKNRGNSKKKPKEPEHWCRWRENCKGCTFRHPPKPEDPWPDIKLICSNCSKRKPSGPCKCPDYQTMCLQVKAEEDITSSQSQG